MTDPGQKLAAADLVELSLEDEWPYRRHPQDWQNYHTRYMTPEVFQNALRSDPPR